jgi:hypothetical protein
MKKTALFTFIALAVVSSSFAQISFGPKLGVGLSTWANTKVAAGKTYSYSPIITPQVGAVLNVQLGDYLAVRPELLFIQRGATSTTYGYDSKLRASYLELPINIAGGVKLGPGRLEAFAGAALGVCLGGKYKRENSPIDRVYTIKPGKAMNADLINPNSTVLNINPLNVSLNFGIDYKFDNGFLIQAGYNLGLTNVTPHYEDAKKEEDRSKNVTKASAFNLSVAYLFGGKK